VATVLVTGASSGVGPFVVRRVREAGHPVRATARRARSQFNQPSALIAESAAYGPETSAVRWQCWKLVSRNDEVEMRFILRRDPPELNDPARSRSAIAADLRGLSFVSWPPCAIG